MSRRNKKSTLRKLFIEVSLLAMIAALAGVIGRSFGDWEVAVFIAQVLPLLFAWQMARFLPSHYVGLLIASAVFVGMLLLVVIDSTRSKNPLYVGVELTLTLAVASSYYLVSRAVARSERWLSDRIA